MIKASIFAIALSLSAALSFAAPTAWAMSSDDGPAKPAAAMDPDYAAGKKAIEAKDWKGAIDSLTKAAGKDAKNPDIQNYLGYAYRNSGNYDMAFKHYEAALQIDSKHKGAREYLGEAYLLKNDLPKAQEQLDALDRICTFGCPAYTALKRKVAEYKAAKKSS